LEHTAGKFPLWLTPEQVIILPISEKFQEYAQKVQKILDMNDIRAIVDERNEKAGRKIRDAEMNKIPFMLIVGEKEESGELVSVREHTVGDKGVFTIADFVSLIKERMKEELE
jgi:threonyl-tRNA synthetase